MESLFNLISIFYVFRSVQLSVMIWREWADIVQEPLTRRKKYLAEQASFFLAVPLGVFFHELGHALAVWFFGGTVVGFNFRFFWGEVEHFGVYTLPERWLISLAGTLGSLLFGLGVWLALRHNRVSSLRYFGLRAFRFQIYFSLLYYPLFSIILPIGDWRVIYDFAATPILSSVTLVVHLLFLAAYWLYDRQGSFEAPAMDSPADQAQFDALALEVQHNPHDTAAQMQFVDMLRQGGAHNRAKTDLERFLKENPESAVAYLELAAVEAGKQQQVSKKSSQYAAKALQLGLADPGQAAAAWRLVAQYQSEVGQAEAALESYDQALAALNRVALSTTRGHSLLAATYRDRGLVYRRLQKYELAYTDISQAQMVAQQAGLTDLAAACKEDLAILAHHAGHQMYESS